MRFDRLDHFETMVIISLCTSFSMFTTRFKFKQSYEESAKL